MAKAQIVIGANGGGGGLIVKACSPKTVAGSTTITFTTDGTADLVFMTALGWGNTYINFDPTTGEKLTSGAYYSSDTGDTWVFDSTRTFTISNNSVSFPSMTTSSMQYSLIYTY